MPDQRLAIPTQIIDYARFAANEYIPPQRTGGFTETALQKRGEGDFLELVAKLMLKHFLVTEYNMMVRLELTSGQGDETDMTIWTGTPQTAWNPLHVDVKSSKFSPFHEDLHLFVKADEAQRRPANIYIQCFVHLEEADDPEPHMHVAGLMFTSWSAWKDNVAAMAEIPGTEGAKGVLIPCHQLRPLQHLPRILRSVRRVPGKSFLRT